MVSVVLFTTVAISAATALPSRAPANVPAPKLETPPAIAYQGAAAAAAKPQLHSHAEADDPDAVRLTGRIGQDLTRSLEAAGVPERQGREYVWVLGRAFDLSTGLSVEDKFDLVIERLPDGKLGRLLYAGLDRVGRADLELLKWTDGSSTVWMNADGIYGNSAGMRLPVSGRVTSGFGHRFHPILGSSRFHKGVDLKASFGTPIAAAADGRVVSAGWHGGYGRLVSIAHGNGLKTIYGHMSRIAAHPGEAVRQGQVIGYVGSTGLSTGPHLHYEVMKDGRPVNPMSVKLAGPAQLQGEKLHAFRDALRAVLLLQSKTS